MACTVTWCNVRGVRRHATSPRRRAAADGTVEIHYGPTCGLERRGRRPRRRGGRASSQPVDLSDDGAGPSGGAVGERFSRAVRASTWSRRAKFYQTHPDNYDQLVIWTDTRVVTATRSRSSRPSPTRSAASAWTSTTESRDFGSAGRLRSFVMMDALVEVPRRPDRRSSSARTTRSACSGRKPVIAGSRSSQFRDANGARSDALLGRDQAHWSFFFDSDASVMEGNDIEDLGGGAFTTVAPCSATAGSTSTRWDWCRQSQVPHVLLRRESPTNVVPRARRDERAGDRRHVQRHAARRAHRRRDRRDGRARARLGDQPEGVHRQAFIYVVSAGAAAGSDTGRQGGPHSRAWVSFFAQATEQPHEGGDLAQVAGASGKLPPS